MRFIRRTLQIVALLGTLVVGIIAFALIASQTSWFKDWLRRFIVRQSSQYLNGELSIGHLGGNLFYSVELGDVALRMDGRNMITLKDAGIDYSVFQLVSGGINLDHIRLNQPVVQFERTAQGWNIARLVKRQAQEADRQGPRRPVSIGEIDITDGTLDIIDPTAPGAVRLPRQIQQLNAKLAFHYQPVRFTLDFDRLSLRGQSPQLDLNAFSGRVAVEGANIYLDNLAIRTAESQLHVQGVVETYTTTPTLKLTASSDKLALGEIARIVPALTVIDLPQPAFTVAASGPLNRLSMKVDVRSSVGTAKGDVVANFMGPTRAFEGELTTEHFDLAPVFRDPRWKSEITGDVGFKLRVPAIDPASNVTGTYRFEGPRVAIYGYQVSDVKASGELQGLRVTVDGRARGYGVSATARSTIVRPSGPGGTLSYDLRGSAASVDMRRLPASIKAPRFESNLAFVYNVHGAGSKFSGDATLAASTLEGAHISPGTTASASVNGAQVDYAADGTIANLDLQRLGRKLGVQVLTQDRFASDISGAFTVKGSGKDLAHTTLDASGTLADSALLGGRVNDTTFEAHLTQGALQARAAGNFSGFDPAELTGRANLAGEVNGSLNAEIAIADVQGPIDATTLSGSGTVNLTDSHVAEIRIDRGAITAAYKDQVADVQELDVAGPLLNATAHGRVALDEAHTSDLTFRAQSSDLSELGRLVNQPLKGTAIADGTVKGNRSRLTVAGTLNGSGVGSGDNQALTVKSTYTATVPDLDIAAATVDATSEAMFLKVGGQELNELRAKTTYAKQTLQFDATAKQGPRALEASGNAVFHPDHQEVHLRNMAVATEGIRWASAPNSEATIQYGNELVTLKGVSLTSGDQAIQAEGTIALNEAQQSALDIRATNVDLAQIDHLLLAQQQRMTGRLNAAGKLTGSTTAPRFDGTVAIERASLRGFAFDAFSGKVNYSTNTIGVDVRLQQTPAQWLTARGTLPMSLFRAESDVHAEHHAAHPGDAIDLTVESSEIGLAVFQPFLPQIAEVQGTLQAKVHVAGSGEDPHLDGYVNVKGGAFTIPLGKTSYVGLNTRIELQPDKIIIPAFQVLDDHKHTLNVEGELATHERSVGAVTINVKADDFELLDNELGRVGADADLKITGELRRPRIEGTIELDNTRLQVDQILEAINQRAADAPVIEDTPPAVTAASPIAPSRPPEPLTGAKPATGTPAQEATQTAASPAETVTVPAAAPHEAFGFAALAMDVHLRIPPSLIVRGKDIRPNPDAALGFGDINVTVGGDLTIRKAVAQDVQVVGDVTTVRGTYDFQGRRFDIQRDGRIQFRGNSLVDPALDLSAIRLISGIEARVRIRGTARRPELALSSNPPLDEADILSLIVFNAPANELGEGQRVSLAERAGALATGFIASPLADSIASALNLDTFEIQATNESGQLGPRITLGQQVGNRLFVKFSQGFGQEDASQFELEYQLADWARLRTSISQGGSPNRSLTNRVERGGADLIFFFSY